MALGKTAGAISNNNNNENKRKGLVVLSVGHWRKCKQFKRMRKKKRSHSRHYRESVKERYMHAIFDPIEALAHTQNTIFFSLFSFFVFRT